MSSDLRRHLGMSHRHLGGGSCGGGCDHSTDSQDWNSGESLHPSIDTLGVRALNEEHVGSFSAVLVSTRPTHVPDPPFRTPEHDPELILFVPFTSMVQIKAIALASGGEGISPAKVKLFVNREDVDFSNAESLQAAQELNLVPDSSELIEYPLKFAVVRRPCSCCLDLPSLLLSTISPCSSATQLQNTYRLISSTLEEFLLRSRNPRL